MTQKKEQKAWSNLKDRTVKAELLLHRVENMLSSGMSDVIGINRKGVVFWLELKALDDWPARDGTLPLKNAFEPGQIPFLKAWRSWRGKSWVLLKVGSGTAAQWLLLMPSPPHENNKELAELTKSELIYNASVLGLNESINYLENLPA